MTTKYSEEVSKFIEGTSSHVPVQGFDWFHQPFWFKKVGEGLFEIYTFDKLPQELRNQINNNREKTNQ